MKYPFLENNELVLINYPVGSSGQLLMRLWQELDSRIDVAYDSILTKHNPPEINFEVHIPKRISTWFFDRNQPTTTEEFANFFEFLSTAIIARQNKKKFFEDVNYELQNEIVVYAIHWYDKIIPFEELKKKFNIRIVNLVSTNNASIEYAVKRANLFYGFTVDEWRPYVLNFNKIDFYESFNFVDHLVDNNQNEIFKWLKQQLGKYYTETKENYCRQILDTYYATVVKAILNGSSR